jgi:hypothetical protein
VLRSFVLFALAASARAAVELPSFFVQKGVDYSIRVGNSAEMRFSPKGIGVLGGYMEFAGAGAGVTLTGQAPLGTRVNRLIGRDPGLWARSLPAFGGIRYGKLYPGIDLSYSAAGRQLKSEFLVAPGADPSAIRMKLSGFSGVAITDDGSLRLRSGQGEYKEGAPFVYQNRNSRRVRIEARYKLVGTTLVRFVLGNYDPTLPLVIDPSISFSTYLGGSAFDGATAITTDTAGNVYVAGWTESTDFPGTRLQRNSGSTDVFVAKFNPGGQLLFATYLGGSGSDQANGIAVDGTGSIWVTGWTTSTNFPLVVPYQSRLKGGRDAFVTVLLPDGTAPRFSTYFGGSGEEQANAIAVDSGGSAYIVGQTTSSDLPLLRPIQSANAGGLDAFALKFANSGTLIYSTYLGGAEDDVATGVAVDATGAIVIVGSTWSVNFPVLNAAQPISGGGQDAFVTKVHSDGTALVFSTYLGGTGGTVGFPELASAVAIDASGDAYVGGTTSSAGFATVSAFQTTQQGGGIDGFVAKYSPAGAVLFRTYLGGSNADYVAAIACTASGVVAAGYTLSSNFPVLNPIQAQHNLDYDAFVVELNSTGSSMYFGTLLGGSGADAAYAVAVVPLGYVIAGLTQSYDFPLVAAAISTNGDNYGAFVAKICSGVCPAVPIAVSVTPSAGSGSKQNFQAIFSDANGWSDIQYAEVDLVDTGTSATCRFYYNANGAQVGLLNEAGTSSSGTVTPGVVTSAENTLCILYGAGSAFAGSGNSLTTQFSVSFKTPFAGPKNIDLTVTSRSNLSPGLQRMGSWTVTAPVSNWPVGSSGASGISVAYADVTGDRRPDIIVENAANQFLVAPSPAYQPLSVWVQHGPSIPGQMQYADVNGDGRADALYFDTFRSNGIWVALSTGTGFTIPSEWIQLPFGPTTPDQIQYADVNGDGRADLLYFDTGRTNAVWVCLSTGTGFAAPVKWLQHGASIPGQIQYADVNGDGRADALYFDTFRSNAVWVSLSTGTGFTAPALWLQHGPSTPDQIRYADVNGDGRADALYFDTFRSNAVWVSLSTGTGFTAPALWLQHGSSIPAQIQYADVNGDGKADALYFDTFRSGGIWVSLSTGTGFTPPVQWLKFAPSTPDQIRYLDVNGDGYADAVYLDQTNTRAIWVCYSNGFSFSIPSLLLDLR